MRRSIAIASYTSWCGLGFVRGVKSYIPEKDNPYLYSSSLLHGLRGTILYASPVFLPLFFYKELYRLEINARNLEDEKKTRCYTDII